MGAGWRLAIGKLLACSWGRQGEDHWSCDRFHAS